MSKKIILTGPVCPTVELTIRQGALTSFTLTVKENGSAKDLTDFTPRGEIRRLKDKNSELIASFDVSVIAPPTSGKLLVRLPATVTAGIATPGWFDIEIEDTTSAGEDVFRVLQGPTKIDTEVTAA